MKPMSLAVCPGLIQAFDQRWGNFRDTLGFGKYAEWRMGVVTLIAKLMWHDTMLGGMDAVYVTSPCFGLTQQA